MHPRRGGDGGDGAASIVGGEASGDAGADGASDPGGDEEPPVSLMTALQGVFGGDQAGTSLALVADINGDGWRELLVGAPGYPSGGQQDAGGAYLFLSSSGADGFAPPIILESPVPEASAGCGNAVLGLTDVNGDGAGDIALCCRLAVGGEGRVYIYLSSAGSMSLSPAITLQSPGARSGDWFGTSPLEIPDRNGDGRPELAVSALRNPVGPGRCGSVFIFPSAPGGYDAAGVAELPNPTPDLNEYFSPNLALLPDVNGDGHPELLAADDEDSVSGRYGTAYLFVSDSGSVSFQMPAVVALLAPTGDGNIVYGEFGLRVFALADRNGDGTSELLVYANGNGSGATRAGGLFLFRSSGGTWQRSDYLFIPSPEPTVDGRFGLTVVELTDRSGDGISELLVGQAGDDTDGTDAGALFLYDSVAPAQKVLSPVPAGRFGAALLVGEDRNRDGANDLFVGAPGPTGLPGQIIILRGGVP